MTKKLNDFYSDNFYCIKSCVKPQIELKESSTSSM